MPCTEDGFSYFPEQGILHMQSSETFTIGSTQNPRDEGGREKKTPGYDWFLLNDSYSKLGWVVH